MVPVIFNCFLGSLLNGLKSAVGSIGKSVLSPISYGVKSLFGQSEMQQYERQLSRNAAYQKEMLDYTNRANLEYNKSLTKFNNEQTKEMSKYFYDTYQSPTAQVQSYREAGLNPYMLTSPGSFSPTASSAAVGGASPSSPGGSYQRDQPISVLDAAQYKSLVTQAEYNQSQTNYMNELAEGVRLDNRKKSIESNYWAENASNQAKSLALGNDISSKTLDQIAANINVLKAEENLKLVLSDKESKAAGNLLVERSFLAASIQEKQEKIKEIKQNIKNGEMTYLLLQANKKFVDAQEKTEGKKLEHLIQMIDNLRTEDEIHKLDREKLSKELGWTDWRLAKENIVDPVLDVAGVIISGASARSPKVSSTTTTTVRSKRGTTTHTNYNY